MKPYWWLAVIPALVFTGCSSEPGPYAPPAQRAATEPARPAVVGPFVAMSDPNADAYIVGGISPTVEAATWRWTYRRPELQFRLDQPDGWKYVMDFAIAGDTFKDTGPVTLAVTLNGTALEKKRYDKPGQYKMEVPVPAAAVKAGELNRVAIQPDKVWPTKDGTVLGIILTSAGFRR